MALGTLNLIAFNLHVYIIGKWPWGIQISSAILFALHLAINRNSLTTNRKDLSDRKKQKEAQSKTLIKTFKYRFQSLNESEIDKKLAKGGLVKEAIEALEELKSERFLKKSEQQEKSE